MNLATSCVHHIKQNISMRYGKSVAGFIFPLAKSYYTVMEEEYLQKIHARKKAAIEYLSKIPLHEWHSTEWVQNSDLPPCFGILMSNTSESINSMIDKHCNKDRWS